MLHLSPQVWQNHLHENHSLPNSVCIYIYIPTYVHMKNFIIILKTKRTYLYFLGGWSPQSKHSAIESLSTNRNNLSLCRHHFDLVSFGLQLLIYLIPSSQKPTNLLWSKNIICVCVRVCVKSIQYPICCDMNCRNYCYQN